MMTYPLIQLEVWESATRSPTTFAVYPSMTLVQRISTAWEFKHHPLTLWSPSKPGHAKYCTISGAIQSLLRDHRRHVRNEDLRTELDYYSKKYDEEREMEPKLVRVREATSVLRIRSPHVRRHKGRVVEFKDALNRDGSKTERESDGRRTTLF
ncbi:hypothetical protein Tco_1050203 [Tanacetum coccineum]